MYNRKKIAIREGIRYKKWEYWEYLFRSRRISNYFQIRLQSSLQSIPILTKKVGFCGNTVEKDAPATCSVCGADGKLFKRVD